MIIEVTVVETGAESSGGTLQDGENTSMYGRSRRIFEILNAKYIELSNAPDEDLEKTPLRILEHTAGMKDGDVVAERAKQILIFLQAALMRSFVTQRQF